MMNASSMADRIIAAIDGLGTNPSNETTPDKRKAYLEAFCQGIIAEIQQNAVVTTSDAQGGTNTGTVA